MSGAKLECKCMHVLLHSTESCLSILARGVDGEAALVDYPVLDHRKGGNVLFQHPVFQMEMHQQVVQMVPSLVDFLIKIQL